MQPSDTPSQSPLRFNTAKVLKNNLLTASRYQIMREIGKGGMGVVYEAYDFELRRKVAIKFILSERLSGKPDAAIVEEVARLRNEARLAARLQHPNIVGAHRFIVLEQDWRDFIEVDESVQFAGNPVACMIMQFIDGCRLSRLFEGPNTELSTVDEKTVTLFWASHTSPSNIESSTSPIRHQSSARVAGSDHVIIHRTAILDSDYVRKVVEIGIQLTDALSHAHRNEVLHNDIKSSNIMVDVDGRVWLSDFGVASDSTSSSAPEGGTFQYTAPEVSSGSGQCQNTDVFSLGATLYRLVTFEFVGGLATNSIDGYESPDPRLKNKSVSKDLAAIIKKSLEGAPSKRYQTAAQFKQDLIAFKEGRVVSANPSSSIRQFGLWAKRNPVAGALVAVVFLVSTIGFLVSTYQTRIANSESLRAKTHAKAANDANLLAQSSAIRAREILNIVKASFEKTNPSKGWTAEASAADILRFAYDQASSSRLDDVGRTELLEIIASALIGTGEYELACVAANNAASIRSKTSGKHSKEYLNARHVYGNALMLNGDLKNARRVHLETHKLRKLLLGEKHPDTIRSLTSLSSSVLHSGDFKQGLALAKQALALDKSFERPIDKSRIDTTSAVALAYQKNGQYTEAIELLKSSLIQCREHLGKDHPLTLSTFSNLADVLQTANQLDDIVEMNTTILELRRNKLGSSHPETLESMINLAGALTRLGRNKEAIDIQKEALALVDKSLGKEHPLKLMLLNNLAGSYYESGDFNEAIEFFEKSSRLRELKLGADHPDTLVTKNNLAGVYDKIGRMDKALPIYETTLARRIEKLGENHPDVIVMMNRVAVAYWKLKKFDKATELYEKCVRLAETAFGKDDFRTLWFRANLGSNYLATGRLELAIVELEVVCSQDEKFPKLKAFQPNLRKALKQARKVKRFSALLGKELELARDTHKPNSLALAQEIMSKARELAEIDAHTTAGDYFKEGLSILEKSSPNHWNTFEAMSLYGEALLKQDAESEQAKQFLQRAVEGLEALSKSHPENFSSQALVAAKNRVGLIKSKQSLTETTKDK